MEVDLVVLDPICKVRSIFVNGPHCVVAFFYVVPDVDDVVFTTGQIVPNASCGFHQTIIPNRNYRGAIIVDGGVASVVFV